MPFSSYRPVHVARNWDGGQQEYNTAFECVKRVFPDAPITPNRTDNYPIRVIVNAKIGSSTIKVWSGRQQSLFRKYRADREKAMAEMVQSLEELKEDFE